MGRTRRAAAKKALVRIHDISVEALAVMKALRKSKNGSRRWHEELNRNATRKQKHIEVIQISSSSESEEEEVKLVRRKKARSSTPNENQKPSAVILRPGPVTRSDCTLTKPSARALVGKSPRSSSQTKPPGSGTVTHLPGGGSVAKSPAPASVTNIQGSELMARRSGSASVKKKPRHASNTKSLRSSHQIDESQGPDSLRKRMDLPSVASPTGLKTERCQKAFLNEQKGPVSSSCNSVRPITTCTPDQASPLDNFPPPNNTITSPLVEPELRADAFESDSFNSVEPAYYDTEIEDAAFQEIPESEALFASNETEIGDEQKLEYGFHAPYNVFFLCVTRLFKLVFIEYLILPWIWKICNAFSATFTLVLISRLFGV